MRPRWHEKEANQHKPYGPGPSVVFILRTWEANKAFSQLTFIKSSLWNQLENLPEMQEAEAMPGSPGGRFIYRGRQEEF